MQEMCLRSWQCFREKTAAALQSLYNPLSYTDSFPLNTNIPAAHATVYSECYLCHHWWLAYFVLASTQQPVCSCRWMTSVDLNHIWAVWIKQTHWRWRDRSSSSSSVTVYSLNVLEESVQSRSLLTAGMTHFIQCNKEESHLRQSIEKSS